MHPIDKVLQETTPTVMVPLHGDFEPLTRSGHRFLVAQDGLWIEVARPWLYARFRLAEQHTVSMPYGAVSQDFQLRSGPIPIDLMKGFVQQARDACPLETAAWIVWNETRRSYRLLELDSCDASRASVTFDRPRLGQDEHLVVDLHSHGLFPAGFSRTDDADDCGEAKIAVVVGHCNSDRTSLAMRLCLNGKFIALSTVSAEEGAFNFKEAA